MALLATFSLQYCWRVYKAIFFKSMHRLLMLEKTLESPLGCKEIQPAQPKGNQS